MKASELRIGSWVNEILIQNNKPIKKEIEVCIHDIVECYDCENSYEPIPLTEEWLLKFGFEKECLLDGTMKHLLNGVYIVFFRGEYKCFNALLHNKLGASAYPKLEYVHQLQNLYFALIGEELTIKGK